MKDNSPNPVDGDVQALIADCLNDIEEIQYEISTYGDESGRRASKLKRQQMALAALTAKPEYNVSFEGGEIRLDVTKAEYNGCHPDYRWISYTTPPAQILRPVELPKETGKMGNDFWLGEMNMRSAFIKAIREAGYQVKS